MLPYWCTPEQAGQLRALERRYQELPAADLSDAAKRQQFGRWLYQHGRLSCDDAPAAEQYGIGRTLLERITERIEAMF